MRPYLILQLGWLALLSSGHRQHFRRDADIYDVYSDIYDRDVDEFDIQERDIDDELYDLHARFEMHDSHMDPIRRAPAALFRREKVTGQVHWCSKCSKWTKYTTSTMGGDPQHPSWKYTCSTCKATTESGRVTSGTAGDEKWCTRCNKKVQTLTSGLCMVGRHDTKGGPNRDPATKSDVPDWYKPKSVYYRR